jgi:hypothetical protein
VTVEHFASKLEIGTPFVASGEIGGDYKVSRMYVGLLQVDRDPEDGLELKAAAYGMGAAEMHRIDGETSSWAMELRPDSEHPDFEAGPAIGFVLVELAGGRVTGWIDDGVELIAGSGANGPTRVKTFNP